MIDRRVPLGYEKQGLSEEMTLCASFRRSSSPLEEYLLSRPRRFLHWPENIVQCCTGQEGWLGEGRKRGMESEPGAAGLYLSFTF